MVTIAIDNAGVDASCVSFNGGLNYGRFDAPGLVVHEYSATFPRFEFVELLSDRCQECMIELRQDDEMTGEQSELAAAGWPSIDALLDKPELAVDMIATFLNRDVFAAFGLARNEADYVINSTDSVEIRDDAVRFRGRCFSRISR